MLSASINEEKLYHICRTKPMFCEQIQYRFSLSLTTSLLLRVTPKAEGTLNAEEDWASATAKAKAEPQKNENFMAPLFIYVLWFLSSKRQRPCCRTLFLFEHVRLHTDDAHRKHNTTSNTARRNQHEKYIEVSNDVSSPSQNRKHACR